MTNPTTTLAKIRSHGPCSEGWEKLLKTLGPNYGEDTPVTLLQILDSNGLKDALWALRACNADRFACLLVCDYAEHVLHLFEKEYPKDKRPANAINVARLFANGVLINGGYAPLSYRDVDEEEYREAIIDFYEYNSIESFKKIFIKQYIFSCENYNFFTALK